MCQNKVPDEKPEGLWEHFDRDLLTYCRGLTRYDIETCSGKYSLSFFLEYLVNLEGTQIRTKIRQYLFDSEIAEATTSFNF